MLPFGGPGYRFLLFYAVFLRVFGVLGVVAFGVFFGLVVTERFAGRGFGWFLGLPWRLLVTLGLRI